MKKYAWSQVYMFWTMFLLMYLPILLIGVFFAYFSFDPQKVMDTNGHTASFALALGAFVWFATFIIKWFPKRNQYQVLMFRK